MADSMKFCSISFTSLDFHLVKSPKYMILQYSLPWQIPIFFHIQLMFVYLLSWFNVINAFLMFCEVICSCKFITEYLNCCRPYDNHTLRIFELYTVSNLEDILLIEFHLFISIITTTKKVNKKHTLIQLKMKWNFYHGNKGSRMSSFTRTFRMFYFKN